MNKMILAHEQQVAQEQPVVIHDLTEGKQSRGIRVGDFAVTDDGLCVVKADGLRGKSLYLLVARHA